METLPLGGIITIVVLLPNLLAVFFPPTTKLADEPQPNDTRLQILTVIERIGQVGCWVIPFFYQLTLASVIDAVSLAIMIGALALYYTGWIRYLVLGCAEELLYSSLLGILRQTLWDIFLSILMEVKGFYSYLRRGIKSLYRA